MLTPADEMMYHQIVSTFDHVENSDLQWTERLWFGAFDLTGKFYIGAGFGKYTNRNVMDGFAGVTMDGDKQYNVRASRALWPDVDPIKVGPISYQIKEPLKKVVVALDENNYGISFEIEAEGIMPVSEQNPQMFRRSRGRLVNHMCRFYHSGRASGWLKVEGKRYEIKKDNWVSFRDRSWGLRSSTGEYEPPLEGKDVNFGLRPPAREMPYLWNWFVLQFKDWWCHYEFAERPEGGKLGPALGEISYGFGDKRKPLHITDVNHGWEFFPGTKKLKAVRETIHTADGGVREVEIKPLQNIYYRRTGGYQGFRNWTGGQWMGPFWIEGEKMDLTDQNLLKELHGVDDIAFECRCGDEVGYGIMEPFIPGVGELLTT